MEERHRYVLPTSPCIHCLSRLFIPSHPSPIPFPSHLLRLRLNHAVGSLRRRKIWRRAYIPSRLLALILCLRFLPFCSLRLTLICTLSLSLFPGPLFSISVHENMVCTEGERYVAVRRVLSLSSMHSVFHLSFSQPVTPFPLL